MKQNPMTDDRSTYLTKLDYILSAEEVEGWNLPILAALKTVINRAHRQYHQRYLAEVEGNDPMAHAQPKGRTEATE